jgi:hypothetical protein
VIVGDNEENISRTTQELDSTGHGAKLDVVGRRYEYGRKKDCSCLEKKV